MPHGRCPASFAGTTYWGVHAFPATNAKGETRFIKFKIAPAGGDVTLTEEEAGRNPPTCCTGISTSRIAAAMSASM